MGNILESYMKQYEEDKENENYDLPKDCYMSDEQKEIYKEKLDALRNSEKEMMDKVKEFNNSFTTLTEKEIDEKNLSQTIDVSFKVKRAYCPNCNNEIVSNMPVVYNPLTFKKIARYECPNCHKRYTLDSSYPRLIAIGADGEEIKCFLE